MRKFASHPTLCTARHPKVKIAGTGTERRDDEEIDTGGVGGVCGRVGVAIRLPL